MMHAGIANTMWRGKRSQHSRCMHNPKFYIPGKRSIMGQYQHPLQQDASYQIITHGVMTWNDFHITGPLCGESLVTSGFPLQRASDTDLWSFISRHPKQSLEQTIKLPVIWDALCSCDIIVMVKQIFTLGPFGSKSIASAVCLFGHRSVCLSVCPLTMMLLLYSLQYFMYLIHISVKPLTQPWTLTLFITRQLWHLLCYSYELIHLMYKTFWYYQSFF